MLPGYARIWPWIIATLVVWMVYRRFRRNFGRQPLRRTSMILRMILLMALAVSLAQVSLRGGAYIVAEAAGALAGVALALWGASRTRFTQDGGRLFYIPHTYTGIAVSALVLGRLVYRMAQLYSAGGFAAAGGLPAAGGPPDARGALMTTPVTVGLFFVLIGYYVCYYGRLLWKSKRITSGDLEAPQAAATPGALGLGDSLLPRQIKEGDRQ